MVHVAELFCDQAALLADFAIANDSGRNRFTAKIVNPTNTTRTVICAIAKGGSFWVGEIALSAGTFSNDCTRRTKPFRYSATAPEMTSVARQRPAICRVYRAR